MVLGWMLKAIPTYVGIAYSPITPIDCAIAWMPAKPTSGCSTGNMIPPHTNQRITYQHEAVQLTHNYDHGQPTSTASSAQIVSPRPLSNLSVQQGYPFMLGTVSDPPSSETPLRSAALRSSGRSLSLDRLHLALLLGLLLFIGLARCGPVSSDNAPNVGPRASVSGPLLSKQSPSPGSGSGTGTISGGDNTSQGDRLQSQPVGTPNSKTDGRDQPPVPLTPEIPDPVAKDLDSPYASLRLSALKYWEANGSTAPLDLVFEALNDENEAVQTKAMEIIERRLAAEPARGGTE